MNPRMFPFAGLFPMQPGHWRQIADVQRQGIAAAVDQQIALPELFSRCPANAYLATYSAEFAAPSGGLVAVKFSATDDCGASYRALGGDSSTDVALRTAGGIALFMPSGASFSCASLADSSGPAQSGLPACSGPMSGWKITGMKAGMLNLSGGGYTIEIVRERLTVWALE